MIALLVLVAMVLAGLELNRRRQADPGGFDSSGDRRSGVPDRDRARLLDDLRAAAARACADW
ncbi:hypothetical protein [Kribbella sp. NPDC051770]|uniref:hypothetical protein n=1 Tax=Kribbella sp. NPDC051770 TaxID=3155413 RepID=UPI00342509D3